MAQLNNESRTLRDRLTGWIKPLLTTLVLWFVLRTLLVGAFHITSGSMEGTLLVGDVLFVNKALYGAEIPLIGARMPGFREPRRFDIVVFQSMEEAGLTVVKRVLGVPGDTIAMRDNAILVNGSRIDEPYVVLSDEAVDPVDPQMRAWQLRHLVGGEVDGYMPSLKNWGPLVVPPDSFFVLGDNRDFSYDSRYCGFLGRDHVRGRAVIVYYSFNKKGLLPLPFLTAVRWRRLFTIPR